MMKRENLQNERFVADKETEKTKANGIQLRNEYFYLFIIIEDDNKIDQIISMQ